MIEISGPRNGMVRVRIEQWEFSFVWSASKREPLLISVVNLAKNRLNQEEDIVPPMPIKKKAKNLARIRFAVFGKENGEQLPLPF